MTKLVFVALAVLASVATIVRCSSKLPTSEYGNPFQKSAHCFCKLEGSIDDCACNVESVDHFNNEKLLPLLQGILEHSFFRYFQYNPHRKCPFWDMSKEVCRSGTCGVKPCAKNEIPAAVLASNEKQTCQPHNPDDHIDATVSDEAMINLNRGKSESEFFCDLDAEVGEDCEVVDLAINPERYTGYWGDSSWRIWKAIYQENCFKSGEKNPENPYAEFSEENVQKMCLEKRAFFRAVSGLHTSITIHLTSRYPLDKIGGSAIFPKTQTDKYGPNLGEFLNRFDPDLTKNQGPFWLRNVYFVFLLELRAIAKAGPQILANSFDFGDPEEAKATLEAVKKLIELVDSFPDHFDESKMFVGAEKLDFSALKTELKAEFRDHFYNITRIMDCVACDKCKLWGKLQMTGLATALKILFADEKPVTSSSADSTPSPVPQLTRHEIVALFNAFGRISTSINQLQIFREMVHLRKKDEL